MASEGALQEQQLRTAGYAENEIQQWKGETAQQLREGGFSLKDVDQYFGVKEPDMVPMKTYFENNLRKPAQQAVEKPVSTEYGPPPPPAKPADDLLSAIEAGWQISVSGLIARGQKPDVVLPEHIPMFYGIASKMTTLAGDLPAMIPGAMLGGAAGTVGGGAVGSALPGIGTAAGAAAGGILGTGAGAFALPEGIRSALMQHYEKGDVKSFSDFWERSSAVFLDTFKAGLVGAATAGTGAVVGKVVAPYAVPSLLKTGTQAMSEVATMVTLGKALEGQIPEPQDFLEAAILVGGLHGSTHVAAKLRNVFAKTGIKPEEMADLAHQDPTVQQDLVSTNVEFPKVAQVEPPKATRLESSLTEKSTVLGDKTVPGGISIPPLPEEAKTSSQGEPPSRSPQEQAILDRIVPGPKKKNAPITFDEAYRRYIDNLHPLKQFTDLVSGGKPVPVKDDPYSLARLTRGNFGKGDQFIQLSPFKFGTLENVGKPLLKILDPVKEDIDGFRAYAVASRAIELDRRAIHTGISIEDARYVATAGKSKYETVFNELQKYQTHLLDYLKDSQVISLKSHKLMTEANKDFVPFYRAIEQEAGSRSSGQGLQPRNPVKEIIGSGRQIIDPIESIIKNTYFYIDLAERNRVMTKMLDLSKTRGEEADLFMKKMTPPTRPIEVTENEVEAYFKERGIEDVDPEAFDIFRSYHMPLKDNEVVVFNKGKREVYKVSPDVAKSVRALDSEAAGLLVQILHVPAAYLRAGTILSPEFTVRNLARDQVAAMTLSKNGYIPFVHALSGLGSLFSKDVHYQNWLKSGGANSAMVSIDRDYIQNHIFKLSKETGLIDQVWNVVKSPFEALRVVSELIENSTRLAEFKLATKGDASVNRLFAGAMDSREVTLDFARIGAKTRSMNLITAFWNAHIQGLDRAARAFKEDPVGMTVKMGTAVTLPSLLLWWANHDDPRWKEIPRWQKDLFWIVMTKNHVFRIPKPFELGLLFGSLPERTLEAYFTDNPKAFKDFAGSLAQAFTPSYIPTFAVPVIEHFSNKSTFTGGPIVPSSVEKLLPEYQYMEYTTETGKMLGKLVSRLPEMRTNSLSSPMVLENYIRAWSGNMGMYALQLADQALTKAHVVPDPVKPAATLSDIPIIKAFAIRYPSATAQSITDFYQNAQKNEQVIQTIHHLAKQGDFDNVSKELLIQENREKLVSLSRIQQGLGRQTQFIRLIWKNPQIAPDEKRRQIDNIYSNMIQTSKLGNKLVDEIAKALK
jgi:hypothetical protein